jgi:hypothetical protein
MDACIGASSSVHAHRRSGDLLKRALQMILDRVAMRLALPSRERCAIVSDNEF